MSFKIDPDKYYYLDVLANITEIPYVTLKSWINKYILDAAKPGRSYIILGQDFKNMLKTDASERKKNRNKLG
jgi:hypothetical protein